ncbi:MAG TPA: PAS domain-containing protein [Roseiflexaceae bacterium]|nr:PAS domain-containing protein [Roseiflexaceae bacterium]
MPPLHTGDSPLDAGQHQADNAALHQRVAELEAALATQTAQANQLRAVLDRVPYALYWKNSDLVYLGCNRRFAADLGLASPAEIVGKRDADLAWQPEEVAAFETADRAILESGQDVYDDNEVVQHPDGSQEWFETYKLPLYNSSGEIFGILATYNNVTARKQAEATVDAQASLLDELSTPVIPLTDHILVVPLVGTVDTRRAHQLLETTLQTITATGVDALLIDITGVPVIDTHVAGVLIQTAQAARMLGARMILTGIRPEVAQALVSLGLELHNMVTYSTLQRGVAELLHLGNARRSQPRANAPIW